MRSPLPWRPLGSLPCRLTTFCYNDTETYRIDVFDYDTDAGLTDRRTFVEINADDGRPDGLTVDAAGGVWVALNRGGAVRGTGLTAGWRR